ncbi:MerR family transcriptional regulator, partial [Streptomyces sp. NPDC001193]
FAQASGLTITALRHYDASGVLPPARVDPESGYRYFRRDQIRTARLIRVLRQLDIPIEQVRGMLAHAEAGADLAPALAAHLKAAEDRLAVQRSLLPFWADAAQPTGLPAGMSVRDLPENTFACTEVSGPAAGFPAILIAYDAVADWIGAHGFAFAGPVRLVYRRWTGTPDDPGNRFEIAWPIEEPSQDTP